MYFLVTKTYLFFSRLIFLIFLATFMLFFDLIFMDFLF